MISPGLFLKDAGTYGKLLLYRIKSIGDAWQKVALNCFVDHFVPLFSPVVFGYRMSFGVDDF